MEKNKISTRPSYRGRYNYNNKIIRKNPLTFTSVPSIKLQYIGDYQNGTDRVVCNKDDEDQIIFRQKGPSRVHVRKKFLFEYTCAPILISMVSPF